MSLSGFSTSNYGWIGTGRLTGILPSSFFCWFNDSLANGTQKHLLAVTRAASTTIYAGLEVQSGALRFGVNSATGRAVSGNTYSANTWNSAGGMASTTTSRAVYLNGVRTNATNAAANLTNVPQVSIGARRNDGVTIGTPATGIQIAECGIWDTVLTDDEFASLHAGTSPLSIRPQNLLYYWPGVRDLVDFVGPIPTTAGTLTPTDHPRIYK